LSGGLEGCILDVCGDYAQVTVPPPRHDQLYCATRSRDERTCGAHALISADDVSATQVQWKNGSVRFYYVGKSPWRPDADGADTGNPRAVRCLAFVR
jgi:hypothetical protein